MITTDIILILFGSLFVTLSILAVYELHLFRESFGVYIADAVSRQRSGTIAQEQGYVRSDDSEPLPTGLLRFDEDALTRAEIRREELRRKANRRTDVPD